MKMKRKRIIIFAVLVLFLSSSMNLPVNFSEAQDINIAPVADFTYSPTLVLSVNQTISFTDTSTSAAIGGSIVSWLWDFGDGTGSTLQNPTHAYSVAGAYTVTLTVTDDDGLTDSESKEITIYGPFTLYLPPTADFTYTTFILLTVNQTISFTDTSTDTDGSIVSWLWNFGDGTTSTVQHPTHAYSVAGAYTVTLTVTDDDGLTDSESKEIAIGTISLIPINVTISNIVINPANPEPIKVDNVSIRSLFPYGNLSLQALVNPEIITPFEKIEDVASCIKSDILSEDAGVLLYLEDYPDIINTISDLTMDILNETPELLGNLELLVEKVEEQATSTQVLTGIQESSIQTSGFGLIDIIWYILKYFIPASPGITVTYIGSGTGHEYTHFIVDTSNTVYAMTIVADGNIIGHVGEGWFAFPWSQGEFGKTFAAEGQHYIIAYPTILESVDWLRDMFTSGFLVYIGDDTIVRIPIEDITHNMTLQPVINETSTIELEIYSGEKLMRAWIKVNLTLEEMVVEVDNVAAVTSESFEISNNRLYMNTETGKKLVDITPDMVAQKANLRQVDSIELRDNGGPTYEIVGTRESNLLWFIPVDMDVTVRLNAETGSVETMEKPWWGFLAS
jgi:PKD repeat protein